MLWVDSEFSAEIATAQVGALKAGVTLVTLDEKDNIDHVASALDKSEARGLLISPHTKTRDGHQRANLLLELMPELIDSLPGQRVKFDSFPNLKNVIHTGHVSIRGTTKFKENMLYTKKSLSTLRIPGSEGNSIAIECFKGGDRVAALTNHELATKAKEIWQNYLNGSDKTLPVFLTLSMQYPLGFATFLASVHGMRKVFVPATYNLAKIAKSFSHQKSDVLV